MISPTDLSVANVGAHLLTTTLAIMLGIQPLTDRPGALEMLVGGLAVVSVTLVWYCYLAVRLRFVSAGDADGPNCPQRVAALWHSWRSRRRQQSVDAAGAAPSEETLPDPWSDS